MEQAGLFRLFLSEIGHGHHDTLQGNNGSKPDTKRAADSPCLVCPGRRHATACRFLLDIVLQVTSYCLALCFLIKVPLTPAGLLFLVKHDSVPPFLIISFHYSIMKMVCGHAG